DCATTVDLTDGVAAGDACHDQDRSGDTQSYYYTSTSDSSEGVTIDADGVSLVRSGSESSTLSGIDGSYRQEVSVGPGGVQYTYVSDNAFTFQPDYHCDESWGVSTSDPAASQPPAVPPECL